MAGRRIERRRRIVVDRDLQVRLVARMALAFFGSLFLFLVLNLGAPVVLGALAGYPDWGLDVLGFRIRFLFAFVAMPLLSSVLVLFAVGVRATFGVAGPLYRFREVFRDLSRLRFPRGVRIRRDDVLQQTARMFDASLVALHDHEQALRERSAAALARLAELSALEEDPLSATQSDALAALRTELEALAAEAQRATLLPRAPYAETLAASTDGAGAPDAPVVEPEDEPEPQLR
jgi:hypothetical protein